MYENLKLRKECIIAISSSYQWNHWNYLLFTETFHRDLGYSTSAFWFKASFVKVWKTFDTSRNYHLSPYIWIFKFIRPLISGFLFLLCLQFDFERIMDTLNLWINLFRSWILERLKRNPLFQSISCIARRYVDWMSDNVNGCSCFFLWLCTYPFLYVTIPMVRI